MQRPFARNFAFKYKSGRSLRHGPRCFHQKARSGLVDGILEGLAGLELRLVRRRDGHRFAGARVATGRCLSLADSAGADADETNCAALLQLTGYHVEDGFHVLAATTLGPPDRK